MEREEMNSHLKNRSCILEAYQGQKANFTATIQKLGFAGEQRALLLSDLIINGKQAKIDHLWVKIGDKTFEGYISFLAPLARIRFNAWVRSYIHGFYSEGEFIDERSVELGLWRISALEVKRENGKFEKAKINKTSSKTKILQLIEKWLSYILLSDARGYLYGRGIAIVLRNALKIDYDLSVLDKIIGKYAIDINAAKNKALEIYPNGSARAEQNRKWWTYTKGLKR